MHMHLLALKLGGAHSRRHAWLHAQMFEYRIAVGKVKDVAEAEAARKRQLELRAILHRQMEEREAAKKLEHDADIDYFVKEQVRMASSACVHACERDVHGTMAAHA